MFKIRELLNKLYYNMNNYNNIFLIDDIRNYIFSFLRLHPKKICKICDDVLVWDKKIKNFIDVANIPNCYFKVVEEGIYCLECYSKQLNLKCIII